MDVIFLIVVCILGLIAYGWLWNKSEDYRAKRIADELERRQKEQDNQKIE